MLASVIWKGTHYKLINKGTKNLNFIVQQQGFEQSMKHLYDQILCQQIPSRKNMLKDIWENVQHILREKIHTI